MPELPETSTVDVCIATYKRPVLLLELLESLEKQKLPPEVTLRAIVVDNDAAGSAQEVVAGFKNKASFPITYDHETVQNISLARNRCLSHVSGDYIAFIDDDERADENWLAELFSAMHRYSADAVFGPVLPVLPDNAPSWAVQGRFYERPRYSSGTFLKDGFTNNALVKVSSVRGMTNLFDPKFGIIKGEDYDFFGRMFSMQNTYVWCDTALVHETVPPDRLTIKYWNCRCYNLGVAFATINQRNQNIGAKLMRIGYRTTLLVTALVALPFSWALSRCWGIRVLQKVCSNYGQLSALRKCWYKRYAQ